MRNLRSRYEYNSSTMRKCGYLMSYIRNDTSAIPCAAVINHVHGTDGMVYVDSWYTIEGFVERFMNKPTDDEITTHEHTGEESYDSGCDYRLEHNIRCGVQPKHRHFIQDNVHSVTIDGELYTLEEFDNIWRNARTGVTTTASTAKFVPESGSSYRVPIGLRYDLIPPLSLKRLAAIYAEGAVTYEEQGYLRKMIKASNIINHMLNHLFLWMSGDKKEDHIAKVAWGAFTLMVLEEVKPYDVDVAKYGKKLDDESILDSGQAAS